ncbi:exonuclease domain-containing protein [Nocardiopsis dassonvillei]|uniref:exonuclease domain-containing protein n=1 Tax=Nocardiopsis dassonvillei TaxID=2014 RepID=UPI0020A303F1|nr:exonuclease domain-containing protein [Nocardiopsis dassonvillei]MCP3012491.1 exonuclease domain-containing protein [Nocardiopsis dassonvillei]
MSRTWTAIDFETANHDRGSACAVGLVRVRDGAVVDRYTTLIRPPRQVDFFSRHNIAVHGITAADVADAPSWEQAHARIVEFADGSPLVAHNAAFDMGVLRQACGHTGLSHPAWEYACTLALSRRTWGGLPDHKLPTVCAHIGHRVTHHHRADADAEAAARIVIAAMERYGTPSLADLARAARTDLRRMEASAGSAVPAPVPAAAAPAQPALFAASAAAAAPEDRFGRWQRDAQTSLPEPSPDADPTGPLYGRTVCVSGDLESMDKPEVWRRVAEAGGRPAKNVTKKTDVLVLGGHGGPGKTAKHLRAETYRERGQRIDLVTEAELLALLGMTTRP